MQNILNTNTNTNTSFFMLEATKRVFQMLDHAAIYVLIAGSYTPIMMITLHHIRTAAVILIVEWVIVIVGVVFSMASDINQRTTTIVELIVNHTHTLTHTTHIKLIVNHTHTHTHTTHIQLIVNHHTIAITSNSLTITLTH